MASVLIYLTTRFVSGFLESVEHWYSGGFKFWIHRTILALEWLDRIFALRVNVKHLFEPLYQDKSFIGYVLGFVFRSFRVGIAAVVYLAVLALSLALYLLWIFIPPYLIYKFLKPYAQ
ncbi:MAG: hypothetical protein HYR95_02800 [Candidatus Colwellbacteria bacterium]|nr:hypothetical protein [Candidatus Colwellbacteria bacterium]